MVWNASKVFIVDYFIQHNSKLKMKSQDKTQTIFDEQKEKKTFPEQISISEQIKLL